jgi:hypothetical protein
MQMKVPAQALTRRSRQAQAISFVLGAAGIFVLALGVLLLVIRLLPPNAAGYGLYNAFAGFLVFLGGLLIVGAIALFIRAVTWKTDNGLAAQTGQVLQQLGLDASYVFIRNISRRQLGYIDAVLVGLPGILVLRILDTRGILANERDKWLRGNPRKTAPAPGQPPEIEWLPARISPTTECIADIDRVRSYLIETMRRDLPVFGLVVFTQPPDRVSLALREPVVPVTHLSAIAVALNGQFLAANRMNITDVTEAARALFGENF